MAKDVKSNVNSTIRRLRKKAGLTLAELASQCDITTSFLSQVERGVAMPSLGVLHRISRGLGVPTFYLFIDDEQTEHSIVRRNQRRWFRSDHTGVVYQYVSPGSRRHMEAVELLLEPGQTTDGEEPMSHRGEELALVLEGQVEFQLMEEVWELAGGDSVQFEGELPHRYSNVGDEMARVLTVTTPPP